MAQFKAKSNTLSYITNVSPLDSNPRGHANKKNDSYAAVNAKFFGIFGLVYQSYFLVGNLIASLVLSYASFSTETSVIPTNVTSLVENISTSTNHAYSVDPSKLHQSNDQVSYITLLSK